MALSTEDRIARLEALVGEIASHEHSLVVSSPPTLDDRRWHVHWLCVGSYDNHFPDGGFGTTLDAALDALHLETIAQLRLRRCEILTPFMPLILS